MDSLLAWGVEVVVALQTASPWLDWPALAITLLGSELALMLAATIVYWRVDRRLGFRLAVLLVGSALVNVALKAIFAAPRPFGFDPRVALIGPRPTSGGLPSGHAQLTMTLAGALGWVARRRRVWVTALSLVALVSLSRLYLGVHFPHDLVAGLLLGALAAAIFVVVENARERRFGGEHELSDRALVVLGLALGLPLLASGHPFAVGSMGLLGGVLVGDRLVRRGRSPGVGRPRWLALGAGGLGALHVGAARTTKALALVIGSPADLPLRFVRYGMSGLWIAWFWPALHERIVRSAPPR